MKTHIFSNALQAKVRFKAKTLCDECAPLVAAIALAICLATVCFDAPGL